MTTLKLITYTKIIFKLLGFKSIMWQKVEPRATSGKCNPNDVLEAINHYLHLPKFSPCPSKSTKNSVETSSSILSVFMYRRKKRERHISFFFYHNKYNNSSKSDLIYLKVNKYYDLIKEMTGNGYKTRLCTVELGAGSFCEVPLPSFEKPSNEALTHLRIKFLR